MTSAVVMDEFDAHRRHVVSACIGVVRNARADLRFARQRGDVESAARCLGRVTGAIAGARQFRLRR